MKIIPLFKTAHRHTQRISGAAARLVFPPQCVACDAYLKSDSAFCARCKHAVFRLEGPKCTICGETREISSGAYAGVDERCGRCLKARPKFEHAQAYWEYSGSVSDAIQRAKYGHKLWIVRSLARQLAPWFRAALEDISEVLQQNNLGGLSTPLQIICVPMHPNDLRKRGFNLAYLLLRECLKAADYPPEIANLLIKTRQTHSQAGLGHLDRQINLRDAFACQAHADLSGQSVLLFDDVLTTGATANEVAKTLLKAGASRVFVLSAARALKY